MTGDNLSVRWLERDRMPFDRLGRREFIAILGGATAWPLAAHAQKKGAMRRVGVLMALGQDVPGGPARVAAFDEGLQKRGWAPGRNVRLDVRWATADVASIERSAKELVASRPDLILSHNTPTTTALLQQTDR